MLGCSLLGPDNSNRWLIMDEHKTIVGFIQYKKLYNENVKKGYPKTYGYQTELETNDILFKSTRKIQNEKEKNIFNYVLDIKRENGNIDHVVMYIGDCPSLTLWSKDNGFMNFKIDDNGLYLNFKSQTESFNTEEILIYKTDGEKVSNHAKEYLYQLKYCDKSIELNDKNLKGIKIREIIGKSTPYQQNYGEMKLIENTWINGKLRTSRENLVIGTVEEMAVKHGMGIDAFKHFRFLINQILPFKQEVIYVLLENCLCQRDGLSLFVPDLGIAQEEQIRKELKK